MISLSSDLIIVIVVVLVIPFSAIIRSKEYQRGRKRQSHLKGKGKCLSVVEHVERVDLKILVIDKSAETPQDIMVNLLHSQLVKALLYILLYYFPNKDVIVWVLLFMSSHWRQ